MPLDPDSLSTAVAVMTGLIAIMTSIAVGLFAAIRIAVAPMRSQLEAIEATQLRHAMQAAETALTMTRLATDAAKVEAKIDNGISARLIRVEDKVDRLVEQGAL